MYPTKDIIKEHLCTYSKNKDTCQGDSGGPLTVMDHDRFTVIGVISWEKGCADKHAGVYARVTEAIEWIRSIAPDTQVLIVGFLLKLRPRSKLN